MSTKWNEYKIEKEIRNTMKFLNIDRMPTVSEMKVATRSYGLGLKVTRTFEYECEWCGLTG